MRFVTALFFITIVIPRTVHAQAHSPKDTSGAVTASYYSSKYNHRRTASGERFNNGAMTAAHRTYPFGTRLRLTNVSNNRTATVRVNDRGPFVDGREISVTKRAAQKLGFVHQGLTQVRIEQVH
ncbi:MAG: septal ring lytic transglycosylase RlpA family protein [Acidobacteriaceae bacterium]|nr:septal ring lytic transglycosylase RlpA family protein [Acidobacteriaceae bacterium]MBV9223537.1 septal ring lytic transglycosylase RlpA family protein [Acidobacteriaceae bacterium]MBV9677372.1 septal ring lytic transglycosylase RlpA family protein [Acidobacteriaceae bacterium]